MAERISRGAEIWASVMRITPLESDGSINPGSSVYVTDTMVKVTPALVYETGDEIAVKVGSGDLGAFGKHDDILKWGTCAIEFAIPDPELRAVLSGGTVFTSDAEGLGAIVDGPTVTTLSTGGTLKAGTYVYALTQGNAFGETPLSPTTAQVTSGSSSENIIELTGAADGANYFGVYGRVPGNPQNLAYVPNIGAQATSAATGTGTVAVLTIEEAPQPIPAGVMFIISGDTNTPKVIFTVTETAIEGSTTLSVSAPSITTTIAAADLIQVYVDNGSVTPNGTAPVTDMSAGPGVNLGFALPDAGIVGNANGVSIEIWEKHIIDGEQDSEFPWIWNVFPKVTGLHETTSDLTNANKQTMFEGVLRENANWNQGPNGDFPFAATQLYQDTVCGSQVVPAPSTTPTTAL